MLKITDENIFPNFCKIQIHHKNLICNFTKNFSPYSDFNFTSMWIYNTNSKARFAWLNNNLVICIPDYITNKLVFSFLGNNDPIDTINKIIDHIKKNNLDAEISLLPEESVKEYQRFKQSHFLIEENPDQHDYIIPLKESADLTNIHHNKVIKYQKFIENFPDYKLKEIFLNDPVAQYSIINLFKKWASQKKKLSSDIKNELTALKKLLRYSQHFELISHGLFINNELVGFIIDERIQGSYIIGHFIKADMNFPGVYEVLNKTTAEIHYGQGYKYINIEQDLGIPGLKLYKSQRSPAFFLKKYSVKI